jgi:hypothetical protein
MQERLDLEHPDNSWKKGAQSLLGEKTVFFVGNPFFHPFDAELTSSLG